MGSSRNHRFEREKQAYWAIRDELLKKYFGKWVAIVNGKVVASGKKKMAVLKEAFSLTRSEVGYITKVGYEEKVQKKRIRQVVTGEYNKTYEPSMPMVETIVTNPPGDAAKQVNFIVDTGADLTLLREEVADELGLKAFVWDEADVSGIGAKPQRRVLYLAVVQMAQQEFPTTVDCRSDLNEDILGRDIINEFELTVCAKKALVRFEFVSNAV
jgi:predicted aspartyl protease